MDSIFSCCTITSLQLRRKLKVPTKSGDAEKRKMDAPACLPLGRARPQSNKKHKKHAADGSLCLEYRTF
jgi:hypothetical protein